MRMSKRRNNRLKERLERLRKIKEYSWYAILYAIIISSAAMANPGLTLSDYAFVGWVAILLMIGGLVGVLSMAVRILWICRIDF